MIDEGSQLWRVLPTPVIVEKHAGRHWHEPLQHLHEPSGFQRAGGDRLRHLAESQTFDSRTKQGGEIARDERPRDDRLHRFIPADKSPRSDRAVRPSHAQTGVLMQVVDTLRLRSSPQILRAADDYEWKRPR